MGFKIGIIGCGQFANSFIELYNAHPLVEEVVLCDIIPERVEEASKKFGIEKGLKEDFYTGTAPVHNIKRLPESFKGWFNGHHGSHQFLTDDFCKAVSENKMPPNHAWAAAKYCVPGLIAHQSSIKGGQLLEVPFIGELPNEFEILAPDDMI